jgi:hypothetical protein
MSRFASSVCSSRARALLLGALLLGASAFSLALLSIAPALAQNATAFQRSYISPFPDGDRHRMVVLGGSLGDGLWSGLYRAFEPDPTVEVIKRSKASTGLVRPDRYDWNAALDEILKDETYQIAVVMFGTNDAQSIRKDKKVLKPGTDAWREAYGERVEAFIKKLRAANVAVYWVGLPVMRAPHATGNAEFMNEIFREKAFINGAKFVETWSAFTDQSGRYSAYGPDMQGQVRRLRANDGVHFTMRGYLKLAHFVEKELRRDLSLAKLERNIPLAGNEDEQSRVIRKSRPARSATPARPVADSAAPDAGKSGVAEAANAAAASVPDQATAQAAAQRQVSQVGGVNIIRPAISQPSLEASRILSPQSAASSLPDNETVAGDLEIGLTALATISSVSGANSTRPRLPLTQRPYYKVLIQGEQLEPKAGRSDDFTWPPS